MPICAAGARPVTVRLAQTSSQCIKQTLSRYLPLQLFTIKPANSVEPTLQIIARNRVRPRRSHKPSRLNLHSARQPPYPLPRFPSLEAFGRRPPVLAQLPMRGRHPKPFTGGDISPVDRWTAAMSVCMIALRQRRMGLRHDCSQSAGRFNQLRRDNRKQRARLRRHIGSIEFSQEADRRCDYSNAERLRF